MEVDEGAGTLKFIKIKKFIRSNSTGEYTAPFLPGFSYLLRRENSWGRERVRRGKGCCALLPKRPKGIIIISVGLGLLKRKQTPLAGAKNVLPSCRVYSRRTPSLIFSSRILYYFQSVWWFWKL